MHHAPVAVAPAHEPLSIAARIDHPEQVKRALLVYRAKGAARFVEVPLKRSVRGYEATIPGDALAAAWMEYAIELERLDGSREAAFASREAPHRVQVPPDGMDVIEAELEARHGGRRNVFSSRAEFVSFGQSPASFIGPEGVRQERLVSDRYYRIEAGYAYRPLRAVNEFRIRVGVVRGSAPVPVRDLGPGLDEDERFDVGLNYGATTVRFRFADRWFFDGSLLANVTEVGFSAGTGAALHIGDPFGTKLSLGFEAIQDFGVRLYSQVDIRAHERVRVSPIVELTNMPSADRFGVRLIGEVGVDLGAGFAASVRTGYQARESTSGGASTGGMLSYGF